MIIAHQDDWLTIHQGDCRAVLAGLEAGSVHCVVTSPPYWGLRDYGTASWEGGDAGCDHKAPPKGGPHTASTLGPKRDGLGPDNAAWADSKREHQYRDRCGKCGATRQDAQLGLEPTPEEYVANMVAVFREVRRVLRDDGTLWLNLGDSYHSTTSGNGGYSDKSTLSGFTSPDTKGRRANESGARHRIDSGLKPKDLVGIPWAVARALQAPYYTGRIPRERDRVWLAAMVDAEGTICGFDHDRADGGGHRSGVHLTITNTSTALLDEAHRIWPTSRSEHDRPGEGHMGLRPSWRWIVHGIENKMAALRDLYPHLVVKRQQAVAAYTLLTLMADAKRLARTPQAAEVVAKRAVLTGLLSDLNQGRPVTPPSWLIEPPSTFEPGWYLRSDIIWAKPNPMPESVTDRPTKSHEYLFLLAKSERYYFDADAVREGFADDRMGASGARSLNYSEGSGRHDTLGGEGKRGLGVSPAAAGRNIRSVWTIATQPYPGAHFATFPPKLVEPCILAGTSERGVCPECGAPWRRVVEREVVKVSQSPRGTGNRDRNDSESPRVERSSTTTGWQPTCDHDADPIPATVLDPFGGSGTTAMVAQHLGRRAVLIELNPDYIGQQLRRNAAVPLGLETVA